MSAQTHTERIISLLSESPGLDDDDIARALSISPRQTVNQICRRLANNNVLTRVPGARGKIVNHLTGSLPPTTRPRCVAKREQDVQLPRAIKSNPPLVPTDLERTLIVIPCSKAKQEAGGMGGQERGIADSLPQPLARELEQARAAVRERAVVNERAQIPAWRRYTGSLYRRANAAIPELLSAGAHIAIISGGYGIVLATEPIGWYEAPLRPSWWPRQLIARVLLAYAEHHGLRCVRAFASSTSKYRDVLAEVDWSGAGLEDALLLMPETQAGGSLKSPASIGDALAALSEGTLESTWRSCYGLGLNVQTYTNRRAGSWQEEG